MQTLVLLQFIDKQLRKAGLAGSSISGPSDESPLRFTSIPKEWMEEQRMQADAILLSSADAFAVEQYKKITEQQARDTVAGAGITVTYEPTGEQLQLWCRNETDFASYRNLSTQLKDAADFNLPARAYRVSTMQGGWNASAIDGDPSGNRTALRKMIALYSDQAQQYYEQIV